MFCESYFSIIESLSLESELLLSVVISAQSVVKKSGIVYTVKCIKLYTINRNHMQKLECRIIFSIVRAWRIALPGDPRGACVHGMRPLPAPCMLLR